MKLRKEHFVKLEKPTEEEYIFGVQTQGSRESKMVVDPSFEKDLKEWERKYIKPTPKWKKFSDEKPNNGQKIYLEWEDCLDETIEHFTTAFCPICLGSNNEYDDLIYTGDAWASVEEHQEDLKYFEEHQQIFEGWEFVESKSKSNPYYNGEEHFIKGGSMITIHDKGFCVSKDHVTIYYGKNGPNAVEILKLICKDNDIEL